jgi:hypothetical protein
MGRTVGAAHPAVSPRRHEEHEVKQARQQNSWVQGEEVSSRQDAKNAKESTELKLAFQPVSPSIEAHSQG